MGKEKVHTTNYINTFIEVADDCPVHQSEIPQMTAEKKTVAQMQYEKISRHPYAYTSDDILFQVFADRNDLTKGEYREARAAFFSKGQACFRASPLTKRYGFGIHCNAEGKIALFGMETREYAEFLKDDSVKKVKAMRTSRK